MVAPVVSVDATGSLRNFKEHQEKTFPHSLNDKLELWSGCMRINMLKVFQANVLADTDDVRHHPSEETRNLFQQVLRSCLNHTKNGA